MKSKSEIIKGCGKKINCGNYHLYCGDSGMYKLRLCPLCQSQLNLLNEFEEMIKNVLKDVQLMLIIPSRRLRQDKIDGINETLMFVEQELLNKLNGVGDVGR